MQLVCMHVFVCHSHEKASLCAPPPHWLSLQWTVEWVAGGWTCHWELSPPSMTSDTMNAWCVCFSFSLGRDNLIQGISTEFNYSWTMWRQTRAYKSAGPTCLFITTTIYGKCVTAGRDEPVKGWRRPLWVCVSVCVCMCPVGLWVSSVWSHLKWNIERVFRFM